MIGERVAALPHSAIVVAAVVVALIGGGALLGTGMCSDSEGGLSADAPMHVEAFQVAEPLNLNGAKGEPWETITAVTEPYDEVEAAMGDESERLASSDEEVALQCRTVLKEIAYCTSEDAFLDLIATVPNLETQGQRERFLERVQRWFEPGGTERDCERLLKLDEMSQIAAKRMWAHSGEATKLMCDDFGEQLLELDALKRLGVMWEQDDERWRD